MDTYKLTILIVDDDAQILRVMKPTLSARGCDVVIATNGSEAIKIAEKQVLDLIILDLNMPGLSGFDVCNIIRKFSRVPIIILSARDSELDKITALDLGANDYITKPFNLNDLLARMTVALRRISNGQIEKGVFSVGDITIDFNDNKVLVSGIEVKLTPTEYDLLIYLMNNVGKLVTRQDLVQRLWGLKYSEQPGQIRVLINQLRNKIEPNPEKPRFILNEPGVGYKFLG